MSIVSGGVIGMVHLKALPGSPRWQAGAAFQDAVVGPAVRDARALVAGGVDGVIVENFGDVPFAKGVVGPETVAAMAVAVRAVIEAVGPEISVGVNVLRNDAMSALAVALACGAGFIRVNVLAGVVAADQGLIEGDAYRVMRYRRAIDAVAVAVWADVRVKHAAGLVDRPLEEEVAELVERAGAQAVIVSGVGTGQPTDPARVAAVMAHAGQVPVYVGSGVTASSAGSFGDAGLIVGTWVKRDGRVDQPVDPERVRAVVDAKPEAST